MPKDSAWDILNVSLMLDEVSAAGLARGTVCCLATEEVAGSSFAFIWETSLAPKGKVAVGHEAKSSVGCWLKL